MAEENNLAFIDGQNLHLGTTRSSHPWRIKLSKFKIYLEKKYNVDEAYYFLGYVQEVNQEIYSEIQKPDLSLSLNSTILRCWARRKAMWTPI